MFAAILLDSPGGRIGSRHSRCGRFAKQLDRQQLYAADSEQWWRGVQYGCGELHDFLSALLDANNLEPVPAE